MEYSVWAVEIAKFGQGVSARPFAVNNEFSPVSVLSHAEGMGDFVKGRMSVDRSAEVDPSVVVRVGRSDFGTIVGYDRFVELTFLVIERNGVVHGGDNALADLGGPVLRAAGQPVDKTVSAGRWNGCRFRERNRCCVGEDRDFALIVDRRRTRSVMTGTPAKPD